MILKSSLLLAAFLVSFAPQRSSAAIATYFVGVDSLATIASGEFAGQANPNYNRLTFLYAHTYETTPANNHYHSKGIYRYQPGSGAAPVIEMSPSNYLPETASKLISFTGGDGLYAGKSVAFRDPLLHESQIDLRDTADLGGFAAGTGENVLFNSSAGRWTGSFAGADVHLVLVSISDGLNIGSASALDIGLNRAGDEFHLGADVDFSPVFWTDGEALPGTYSATFKLVDEEGLFGDSGNFSFQFGVVPEPSAALLSGLGVLGLLLRRRR